MEKTHHHRVGGLLSLGVQVLEQRSRGNLPHLRTAGLARHHARHDLLAVAVLPLPAAERHRRHCEKTVVLF
jgi:hypothetical protein